MSGKQSGRTAPWLGLGNWFGKLNLLGDSPHRSMLGRKLGFESLERRAMLSGNPGATILGTAFDDKTLNGLTSDDAVLAGVTIKLYRDGGNGTFQGGAAGSDDTLVATTQSTAAGKYKFDAVDQGTYFVQEVAPTGYVLPASSGAAIKVVVSSTAAAGVVGVPIDSFLTDEVATASSLGSTTATASTAAPEALGGYRDLFAQLTSGVGEVNLEVNAFDQHLLEYNSTATGVGSRTVTWDGGNGTAFNAVGLNHTDLTRGGTSTQMSIVIGADHDAGQMTFRVYKDANNWSTVTVPVPNTGGAALQTVTIPFSAFTVGGGSGAGDFTDVGAVQLQLVGGVAVNGQVSAIGTVGPTQLVTNLAAYQPASVGDFVFWDMNKSGIQDAGEQGAANVAVQLLQNGSVVATTTTNAQGAYSFSNLVPGNYSLKFVPVHNAIFTLQDQGGNPAVDSDADGSGAVGSFSLTSGQNDTTRDAGLLPVDLSIAKIVDKPTPAVGTNATFTITVTNASGYSPATGVTVSDVLPAGLSLVSASPASGSNYNGATGVWTIDSLAGGASTSLTLVTTVQTGGTKTNTARITSADEPDVGTIKEGSASVTPPGALGNFVFWDLNRSGTQDPSEPGVPNVTVQLLQNGNVIATTTTNAQGAYGFDPVAPGNYNLSFIAPGGDVFTAQHQGSDPALDSDPDASGLTPSISLPSGQIDNTHDAGLLPVELSIAKAVSNSTPPVGSNVTFTITVSNGANTSEATGVTVNDVLPSGMTLVSAAAAAGAYNNTSGVWTVGNLASGASAKLTIVASVDTGGTKTNIARVTGADEPDVGTIHEASASVTPPGSIGDLVFWDFDRSGTQDMIEPGVEDVTVKLLSGSSVIATTVTNAQGLYQFNNVAPGTYSLKFITPHGSAFTSQLQGGDPALDSDADASGTTPTFTLASGANDMTHDAGLLPIELSIAKKVDNSTPEVGKNVTFTITVTNAQHSSKATNVTIDDALPPGLTFVSATAASGSSYNRNTGVWTINNLTSGASTTLTITATVATQGIKTNIAEVTAADEPDVGTIHEADASVIPFVKEIPPLIAPPPKLSKAMFLGR